MTNRYNFHARKSDTKNIEKHQTLSRKGGQNKEKTYQKYIQKEDRKTEGSPSQARETPGCRG